MLLSQKPAFSPLNLRICVEPVLHFSVLSRLINYDQDHPFVLLHKKYYDCVSAILHKFNRAESEGDSSEENYKHSTFQSIFISSSLATRLDVELNHHANRHHPRNTFSHSLVIFSASSLFMTHKNTENNHFPEKEENFRGGLFTGP